MLAPTATVSQPCVSKSIKAENEALSPPESSTSLAELTPDLIRKLSESMLVYEYDRRFHIKFESKLEELCRPTNDIFLRKAALKALGLIGSRIAQARIAACLRDSHSIIRLIAIRAFACMFRRNVFPGIAYLEAMKACAHDEFEPIRYESVDLIWALASCEPNFTVSLESGPSTLINAMFIQICELCLDSSTRIRAKAARCLGSLPIALEKRLIIQTFSKIPLHELTSGSRQSARFKFHSDDVENIISRNELTEICSSSSLVMIPDHVAGVFVHGLEDECASVRHACLDSVYAFGVQDQLIAMIAFDFIVDMFHDEQLSVRVSAVQAVHGLLCLYPSLNFNKMQLMSLLSNLSDFEPLVRRKTLSLLKIVSLRNAELLQATLLGLLRCVSLFDEDQDIILDAIRTIGASHANLSRIVIESWHSEDPSVFDPQSVLTCTPTYLAFLLFVQSAQIHQNTLPASFATLLLHCHDRFRTKPDLPEDVQLQPWCCPPEVVAKAKETLDAWSKCKYNLAKRRAESLLATLRNNAGSISPSDQANFDFCMLYAEWMWLCCTGLAGECLSLKRLDAKAKQIAFSLTQSFFGLSNEERTHANLLHNFPSVSPSWWPETLSLKRLGISVVSPTCDLGNPIEVRSQAASVICVEADFINAVKCDKLAIRLQVSSQCKLQEISSKDIFRGNVRWSFKLKSKIRITSHDLISFDDSDPATSAQIGFVWCDHPEFWLADPIKIYLHLTP